MLERRERQEARNKLLALAGDLADLGLRSRLLDASPDRVGLLRVWDPDTQALGETVACLRTADGWEFHSYPWGPRLASAEAVTDPGDEASVEAAAKVADLLAAKQRE